MNSEAKWALNPIKFIGFLIICVMLLTILLTASVIFRDLPSGSFKNLAKANIVDVKPPNATVELLGGLLPFGIDETSCLSRHESALYHKELLHKPSSYLISRLRDYEAFHKQCGPHTKLYNRSLANTMVQQIDQSFLKKIPWLVMKTNNYFVPFLFLIPTFEQELSNLFPEKVTIFYFLSRYLFHPTNSVWGLVKRYYQAYLARADEKLGIQIRVLETGSGPLTYVLDQIISCTIKENLLPQINRSSEPIVLNQSAKQRKTIAVLITSLRPGYSEEFRKMYWENPTVTGEIVSVYQPSQEEYQQSENLLHEKKALAEMYLLSLSDKLVTSGWSTFGYVAQGLGGLKPWILYRPNQNRTAHNPPCVRAASFEPCFHAPPNYYDCKRKMATDTSKIVPHVRHCEDVSWGLKLFD